MNAHPHDALIEMVLGHLDPQDQPGVTDHLESCAACRATAKQQPQDDRPRHTCQPHQTGIGWCQHLICHPASHDISSDKR